MAWTTPKSWTTGYKVLASDMNTFLSDNDTALRAGGIAIASQAVGDVVYASSTTQLGRVAIGTANKILTSSGSAPQWSTQIVNAALPTNVDLGGTLDVTGATKLDGALEVSGHTFLDGTLSIGYLNSSLNKILIGGPYTSPGTSSYAQVVAMSTALTAVTGDTSWLVGVNIGPSITTQASETIADVASVVIAEPEITKGSGATVTRASTLWIRNAPTEGTSNYALFVDDGVSQFDGNVIVGGATNLGHTNANEAMVHSQIPGTAGGFAAFTNVTDWGTNRWHVDVIGVAHTVTALTWKGYTAGYEGSAGGGAIVFGRDVGASWSTYCNIMTNDTSSAGEGALSGVKGFMVEPSGMIRVCGGPNTATAQIQMNPGNQSMADDASFVMEVLNAAALISVTYHKAGQARGALFWAEYHNNGVTKIADPDGAFDTADTDNKMCCYKTAWGSGDVTVKNRTGGTADVAVQVIRMQGL